MKSLLRNVRRTHFARIVVAGVVAALSLLLLSVTTVGPKSIASFEAQNIWRGCEENRKECLAEKIADIAIERGTRPAFLIVENLYTRFSSEEGLCFTLTDRIGDRVAQRVQEYETLRLDPESIFCNFGFYQAYARELVLLAKDIAIGRKLCEFVEEKIGKVSSGGAIECFRGFGHALPFLSPDFGNASRMALFGIRECEKNASKSSWRDACISGVFSRLGFAEFNNLYGLTAQKTDPLSLCDDVPTTYYSRCKGNFKRSIILDDESLSLEKAIGGFKATFSGLDTDDFSAIAFTWGYDTTGKIAFQSDPSEIIRVCAYENVPLYRSCIEGAILSIAKNGIPMKQHLQLHSFCELIDRDPNLFLIECPGTQPLSYLRTFFSPTQFEKICRMFGHSLTECAQVE
ncbi:MAG: hypothetical protein RIQ56_573 [Candidatus Parcubacteria bacterium]